MYIVLFPMIDDYSSLKQLYSIYLLNHFSKPGTRYTYYANHVATPSLRPEVQHTYLPTYVGTIPPSNSQDTKPPWREQQSEAKHTIPINPDTYFFILGIQAHESTKDKHGIPISESSPAVPAQRRTWYAIQVPTEQSPSFSRAVIGFGSALRAFR